MKRLVSRVLGAALALAAPCALAQSSNPVAYIYVSGLNGSANKVTGYAAGADGRLTKISGSPWADNVSYLAANGSYLFGTTNISNDNGKNVFSYKIESNGALKYIGANNIQDAGSANACNDAGPLMLDHTGSYLYVFVSQAYCNSKQAIQSFAVNWKTGLLSYVGVTSPTGINNNLGYPLTMAANGNYVYSSGDHAFLGALCGFQKAANGAINYLAGACNDTPWPGGMPSGWTAAAGIAAADPTNHLAMNINYDDPNGVSITKIETVAINTADGSLTTNSTFANMPEAQVGIPTSLVMSPSGKLLAVGGSQGIQIFNFNPNGQATGNGGPVSSVSLAGTYTGEEMYWDTSNHLYVISNADSRLHVFTVTSLGAVEAPGSPYPISQPTAITGHSLIAAPPAAQTQYEASLTPAGSAQTGSGTISMDTTGQIAVQLAGAPAKASYTVTFCPAYEFYSQLAACFDVGTVSTDASGSANASMKFPKSGQWAGDFELNSGSTEEFTTTYAPVYLATLEPDSTLNGGTTNQSGEAQLPLTSGSVVYANGSFQFSLTGTQAGVTFDAIQNDDQLQGPDSIYLQYDFSSTTGNASTSEPASGTGGDVLELEQTFYEDVSEQGFIGGFSVP